MKFEIKKQTKNILLEREEFMIEVHAMSNPKKEEVLAFLNKAPELCVLREIQGNFGRDVFEAVIFVYNSVEAKEKTEYIPKKIKKKIQEEKKKQEEIKKKADEAAKKKAEEEAAKKLAETKSGEVKAE